MTMHKLEKRLLRDAGRAIADFRMIEDGDRILVGISGGKDSFTLLCHRDDLVESLLLSMLFTGKMRSMPPRLRSDDGRNTVIRPLCYAAESDIAEFARLAQFPIIPCDLCGSQETRQRRRVKALLSELGRRAPRRAPVAALGHGQRHARPPARRPSATGRARARPLDRRARLRPRRGVGRLSTFEYASSRANRTCGMEGAFTPF